jgi:hypothetical protein
VRLLHLQIPRVASYPDPAFFVWFKGTSHSLDEDALCWYLRQLHEHCMQRRGFLLVYDEAPAHCTAKVLATLQELKSEVWWSRPA